MAKTVIAKEGPETGDTLCRSRFRDRQRDREVGEHRGNLDSLTTFSNRQPLTGKHIAIPQPTPRIGESQLRVPPHFPSDRAAMPSHRSRMAQRRGTATIATSPSL